MIRDCLQRSAAHDHPDTLSKRLNGAMSGDIFGRDDDHGRCPGGLSNNTARFQRDCQGQPPRRACGQGVPRPTAVNPARYLRRGMEIVAISPSLFSRKSVRANRDGGYHALGAKSSPDRPCERCGLDGRGKSPIPVSFSFPERPLVFCSERPFAAFSGRPFVNAAITGLPAA
jgi:hypothetical protein